MICRICDFNKLVPVLDLGLQPWANNFIKKEECGKEPKYPLHVVYCTQCGCVQLDYTVPKEIMFTDHTYVSGTTKTLTRHFEETSQYVDKQFAGNKPDKSVLDIGSNDGTQLSHYKSLGYNVLGVDPCGRVAEIANKNGINTACDFFNEEFVKKQGRSFDVINAAGVFFHLEELHSAAKGVKLALAKDGVFVVQFLYMKSIVENLAFDQIYHEHLLYYTVHSITKLLKRHGLAPFDAYLAPIHGGSMILFATHNEANKPKSARLEKILAEESAKKCDSLEYYLAFAEEVKAMRARTLEYLDNAKKAGKRIYGFGAPVKGNTFLNYCGIGTQYLECLVERNPLRRGLYAPGSHIPLIMEEELKEQPDIYFVLAWNFKEEILERNKDLIKRGVEFFFPVNPKAAEVH